jgi:hypothetical protein
MSGTPRSATPRRLSTSAGRSRLRALTILLALPLIAVACSGFGSTAAAQSAGPVRPQLPALHESTSNTIGLSQTEMGYTFESDMAVLPPDQEYRFRILKPNGLAEMNYLWDQTKLMHFLAIRDDFTGFAHVHPTLAPDGTWSVRLPLVEPGPYELYADFLIGDFQGVAVGEGEPGHLVLRRSITVPGPYVLASIVPPPSTAASVDGYGITFDMSKVTTMNGAHLSRPKAWTVMYMPARVTYLGQPFNGLEPYLAVFAHFTAFNIGNDLYGHAHPLEYAGAGREGWPSSTTPLLRGGRSLTFHAEFPGAGDYRAFIEFKVGGVLHTASLTLHISQ